SARGSGAFLSRHGPSLRGARENPPGGPRQPRAAKESVLIRACPLCSVESPADDRFCAECGTRLESPQGAPPDCAKCGPGAEAVDADGYCAACGFRRIASKRDHFEVVVSPSFAGASDRGMRHHRNEDFLAMDTVDADAHVIVVCDGVSSAEDADRASEAAGE